MEQIPIPDAPPELREKIAKMARQCLDTSDVGKHTALEIRLNTLVYAAYQLSADEVRVIEGALGDKINTTDIITVTENEGT